MNLKRDSTTFVTTTETLTQLVLNNHRRSYNLKVLIPDKLKTFVILPGIEFIPVENVRRSFIEFHNHVNKDKKRPRNKISKKAIIHKTAILIKDGMKYAWNGDGIIAMKHMGRICIEDDVRIGPLNTIVRGILDDTVIRKGVCIGSHCNIGHNVIINQNTFLTTHICIAGSAIIGENCWFGVGSMVCDHVKITNGVRVGAGSVVTKDINEPGTYVGVPAKKIGEYKQNF